MIFKFMFVLVVAIAIFSVIESFAISDDLVITSRPVKKSLESGETPIIIGNVKDSQASPIEGVTISVIIGNEVQRTITNNIGSYQVKFKTILESGEHTAIITGSKDGYNTSTTSARFSVKTNDFMSVLDLTPLSDGIQTVLTNFPNTVKDVPKMVDEGITNNPVSQMFLQQIEVFQAEQAEIQRKQNELNAHKKFIEEQRKQAQASLQDDLQSLERETEFYNPRNAFARFVADFDSTIQSVFWGQFALTEQKSKEAHEAKMNAIKEGKSPQEAMKIFQRKAGISHRELIEHNADLNIQYGLADNNTQKQFNVDGKLPRES